MLLAGESVQLLGDRALHWVARRRLLIADLHLGKEDSFRRAGVALPSGVTEGYLQRLSQLIAQTQAESLWVLGDLLHGPIIDGRWREQWQHWRARHRQLELAVVPGNHDRALAAAGLEVLTLADGIRDGSFEFRHAPASASAARASHLICGHLHPVARFPGVARRWPSFWLRSGMTVLPAFSEFTGGFLVAPVPGEAIVACVEGAAVRRHGIVGRSG